MKIVIQKVSQAEVLVDKKVISQIGEGLLVLVGLSREDSVENFDYLIQKMMKLRIFPDEQQDDSSASKMDKSVADVGGEILLVSQFTLYADCRKGNRPSFSNAMPPDQAKKLYAEFVERVKQLYVSEKVKDGVFGAHMEVGLINDGPVTIVLEGRKASN